MLCTMIETRGLHRHLTAWREKRGLSLEKVGELVNHNKSTISRWENGKQNVDLVELQKLAAVYGVDPLALLLSPDDVALATRLTQAKDILQAVPADVAERWLQTGVDIAGEKLRK